LRAGADQGAEDAQSHALDQGGKGCDGRFFVHESGCFAVLVQGGEAAVCRASLVGSASVNSQQAVSIKADPASE